MACYYGGLAHLPKQRSVVQNRVRLHIAWHAQQVTFRYKHDPDLISSLRSLISCFSRLMTSPGSTSSFTITCKHSAGWPQQSAAACKAGEGQNSAETFPILPMLMPPATEALAMLHPDNLLLMWPRRYAYVKLVLRQEARCNLDRDVQSSKGAHLVRHHGHSLCKPTGGDGLVQLLMLGSDVGNHDGAAVAAQAVTQHLSHHGVPVGHMGPLLPHAALLQQGTT